MVNRTYPIERFHFLPTHFNHDSHFNMNLYHYYHSDTDTHSKYNHNTRIRLTLNITTTHTNTNTLEHRYRALPRDQDVSMFRLVRESALHMSGLLGTSPPERKQLSLILRLSALMCLEHDLTMIQSMNFHTFMTASTWCRRIFLKMLLKEDQLSNTHTRTQVRHARSWPELQENTPIAFPYRLTWYDTLWNVFEVFRVVLEVFEFLTMRFLFRTHLLSHQRMRIQVLHNFHLFLED